MKKAGFWVVMAAGFGLTGCAMTYEAPVEAPVVYTKTHHSSKQNVLAKAKQALLLEGFQIVAADNSEGYISTAVKNWKMTPAQANCGTTMGIDYLKDNRTTTEVAVNVVVDDNKLTIRSNIQGEYKPGAADQDITLTCVSRGVIESNLAKKIVL